MLVSRAFVACILLVVSSNYVCSRSTASTTDLEIVKDNYRSIFLASASHEPQDATVKQYMATLEKNGTWPDIDYKDQERSGWKTVEHLKRVTTMVEVYSLNGGSLYHDKTLWETLNLAFNFWLEKDFKNPNWWWNEIGVPLQMGEIAVLVGSELNNNQTSKMVQIMARADWKGWTGENTVWMAVIHTYSACLTGDVSYMSEAFDKIYSTVVFTPGEEDGIKIDGSFFQHGSRLYSGSYGASFTADLVQVIFSTKNTSFEIPQSKLSILSKDVLDGQQWLMRGGLWDISCKGRAITRNNGLKVAWNATMLGDVPGSRHSEYEAYASRLKTGKPLKPEANRFFWMADFMTHYRHAYTVSIKMFSKRTYNAECVNTEGKKSVHLSDGTNYIYTTGAEYVNIFPTWDWEKIPGITSTEGGTFDCGKTKTLGTTSFVGGVSDGLYGVAAYDFRSPFKGPISAKKSWFFYDDLVVALGNSINISTNQKVTTSINQCLLEGDVYTSESSTPLSKGKHSLSSLKWVHHNNVGYLFPSPTSVQLNNDVQNGTWFEIGTGSDSPISRNVFNMYLDHGVGVQHGSYQYTLVPGVSYSDFKTNLMKYTNQFKIIKNDEYQTSVENTDLSILSIIFWSSGSLNGTEWSVTASQPSVVQVRKSTNKVSISASNPSRDESGNKLVVTINQKLYGTGCTLSGDNTKVSFNFPTDDHAGEPITITCSIKA